MFDDKSRNMMSKEDIQLNDSTTPTFKHVASEETIYLCNFRVSVDGEWLCLKELERKDDPIFQKNSPGVFSSNLSSPGGVVESYRNYYYGSWKARSASESPEFEKISATYPTYPIHGPKDRDPILIERSNLVNILKLVIKEVIDSSLRFGRQLDSDHIPLQHFFIVLEHVLRHGLRPKKGLLGPKKELWDILQLVEKHDIEATDITASVRDLPTVRTQIGRARAWLRLALMQKKLSDYFQILIDLNQNLIKDEDLSDFYDPQALLRSEEAMIVMGHLVSLNVVDCNLCVKEEDLDSQQGVIDFSLYLRSKKDYSPTSEETHELECEEGLLSGEDKPQKISAVLDQKNYIEELNRHLNATVANLEAKVENLTATNALMKEDLAISKNSLFISEEENRKLRSQLGFSTSYEPLNNVGEEVTSGQEGQSTPIGELEKRAINGGAQKVEALQKELSLQVCIKEEMAMAMKLMEKDIHEKQDTIISLREQLDDIKKINLEMYSKLQDAELSLNKKSDQMISMQISHNKVEDELKLFRSRLNSLESEKTNLSGQVSSLNSTNRKSNSELRTLRTDLKLEQNLKKHLANELQNSKTDLEKAYKELHSLKDVLLDNNELTLENKNLKHLVSENESTMEDLGAQIRQHKLQLETLREEKDLTYGQTWQEDDQAGSCGICAVEFSSFKRRHHCRNCGKIFCDKCSNNKMKLTSSMKPARVCDMCHTILFEALSKKV